MKTILTIVLCIIVQICYGQNTVDPLPSWNEGNAKHAILQFVNETTTEGSEHYIPKAERIVTFDQDGTLWVEQPLYTQFIFAIDMVRTMASADPVWKNQEPFKSIIENPNQMPILTKENIEKILAVTHSGMSTQVYKNNVLTWLKKAQHPRFRKPYTELIYEPMLEVMELFKNHGFKVYIVSGGGQEFIRAYSERVYGLGPEYIIGTTSKVKYEYKNGEPVLIKLPEMLFLNDYTGKPEGINLIIGKRPKAAFGNSDGDQQMLEWSQNNKGKTLQVLVHHDDPIREYAYDKDSKVGTFSLKLMEEAKQRNWIVVSMKNDWKIIFPWEQNEP